jgi:proteic killer suppression protein
MRCFVSVPSLCFFTKRNYNSINVFGKFFHFLQTTMKVSFGHNDLADTKKRKGKFSNIFKQIEKRLDQMESAETLADLARDAPGARCHELQGEQKGTFTVDLTGNWRLRFRPEEPIPLKPDGGIDKQQVVSVIIMGVYDPHKK